MSAAFYHPFSVLRQGAAPLPHGKRAPFGWPIFSLRPGAPALLRLAQAPANPLRLRLTTALPERENKRIEAREPNTGHVFGTFELRAPSWGQTFEVPLQTKESLALASEIELRILDGDDPIWFFGCDAQTQAPSNLPAPLLPHIVEMRGQNEPLAEFHARFVSLASIQPFGPKEAAVLEGLLALSRLPGGGSARSALNAHLNQFFEQAGRLCYEDSRAFPQQNEFFSIENLAPLGVLAQIEGGHPIFRFAPAYIESQTQKTGAVSSGALHLSDAYSLAPFFAALSQVYSGEKGENWANAAFKQLETRRAALIETDTFWSVAQTDGRKQGHNRALNIAFWALALVRTLELLPRHSQSDLWREQLKELSGQIADFQRKDGLWNAFFASGETDSPVDIGASAGLALALGAGVRANLVSMDAYFGAARASAALRHNLSPDGFLVQPAETGATSQLLPWAMGWFAALQATLA